MNRNNEFEYDIDEKEIMKSIEADEISDAEIPDSLKPENIVNKLDGKKKSKRKHILEIAAACVLVVGIGAIGGKELIQRVEKTAFDQVDNSAEMSAEESAIATDSDGQNNDSGNVADNEQEMDSEDSSTGNGVYTVASNYEDIYDAFKDAMDKENYINFIEDTSFDQAEAEGASVDVIKEETNDTATATSGSSDDSDYSSTNVQEEGVDESDFIKTDGKYIYKIKGSKIVIINIQSDKMKKVANIDLNISSSDELEDMYLDNGKLYVVIQRNTVKNKVNTDTSEDCDYISTEYETKTELIEIDVKNPAKPEKSKEYSQEGTYYSSRKADGYIYLFTKKCIDFNSNKEELIPFVNGAKVDYNCMYFRKNANSEFIMSSVSQKDISKTVDKKVICNSSEEVYMCKNAIYLYHDYTTDKERTEITRFAVEDGKMKLGASTLVNGTIKDSFAISEGNGYLRILTTSYDENYDPTNNLYVLDKDLNEAGRIEEIAPGESIYAARYLGDKAYFITYENTDPLFVADLSDPTNPELLGSVEISGFSDYLHMYADDLVLGVGYETGKFSSIENVKLVMFDVSDPMSPQIVDRENVNEIDGYADLDDYKSILVEPEKGIIGFSGDSYRDDRMIYTLYEWREDHFKQVLKVECDEYIEVRGIYSGDKFYIITETDIISYDMKNNYKEIDRINL